MNHKGALSTFILIAVMVAVILFITLVVVIIRAKKSGYIQPIHTVKVEHGDGRKVSTTCSADQSVDEFQLPPFLCGLLGPFQKYFKSGSFSQAFFKAQRFFEQNFQDKYELPWFAVLGSNDSGKTLLLDTLERDLGGVMPDFDQEDVKKYCCFSFLNDAVMVDLNGRFFLKKEEEKVDEKGFRTFLLLLARYRMERPINGVVLTIPMTELYGETALSKVDIQRRAFSIKEKLKALQETLGICVPVYVFLTKTDIVPGFGDFTGALDITQLNNSLGWSIDRFDQKSVEDGLYGLAKKLDQILSQIFVGMDDAKTAGRLFSFAHELLSIRGNLSFYLNTIFDNYLEEHSPILRGFYFTGSNDQKTVLFAKDIMQEKIFMEQGIVYPLVHLMQDKRASFRKMQVGLSVMALLCAGGFWRAKQRFDAQKDKVRPVLLEFVKLADQMHDVKANQAEKLRYISEETLRNLTNLSEVTSKRFMFFSVFIPSTWFSGYRDYLNTTIHKAVQLLIVGSLYTHLEQKTKQFLYLNLQKESMQENLGALIFPTDSNGFRSLAAYVIELDRLLAYVQKYNRLGSGTSIREFNELFHYCFGDALPEDFKENFHRINQFLGHKDLPKIDMTKYRSQYRKNLALLFQNLYNNLFEDKNPNSLIGKLKKLEQTFNPADHNLYVSIEELQESSVILSNHMNMLKNSKTLWVDETYFDPGLHADNEFSKLMEMIKNNQLFGGEIVHLVLARFNQGFDVLKKALTGLNKFFYANLSKDALAKKTYSDGVFALERSLRFLNHMTPLASEKMKLTPYVREDEIFVWDGLTVDQIFEQVSQKLDLTNVPAVLTPKLKVIFERAASLFIKASLMKNLSIEKAIDLHAGPLDIERYLRQKKSYIKRFEKEWTEILTLAKGRGGEFVFLREELSKAALYFLKLIDQVLEADALYEAKDASQWSGETNEAFEIFGVTGKEALGKYLGTQFQRLKFLKELAQPLVVFLSSDALKAELNDPDMVMKWESIIRAIDAKEKNQKDNDLDDLEHFIREDIESYSEEKLFSELREQTLALKSLNFFKRQRAKVRYMMLKRSEKILKARSIRNYHKLRAFFMRRLKGKFPFGNDPKNEVSLTDVREFFEMYDNLGGNAEKVFVKLKAGKSYMDAWKWVQDMDKLRKFFSAFIEKKVDVPEVHLELEFRVNQEQERNGENVIDFTFTPHNGEELIFVSKQNKSLRWRFGDAIEVGFRWCNDDVNEIAFKWVQDEDVLPASDPMQQYLKIQGRKAVFSYRNNWSIFSLLHFHRTFHMLQGEILKFEVPQGDGSNFIGYNKIRFMQDGLTPKDQKEYIELGEVPKDAPDIKEDEGGCS